MLSRVESNEVKVRKSRTQEGAEQTEGYLEMLRISGAAWGKAIVSDARPDRKGLCLLVSLAIEGQDFEKLATVMRDEAHKHVEKFAIRDSELLRTINTHIDSPISSARNVYRRHRDLSEKQLLNIHACTASIQSIHVQLNQKDRAVIEVNESRQDLIIEQATLIEMIEAVTEFVDRTPVRAMSPEEKDSLYNLLQAILRRQKP